MRGGSVKAVAERRHPSRGKLYLRPIEGPTTVIGWIGDFTGREILCTAKNGQHAHRIRHQAHGSDYIACLGGAPI